MATAAKPTAAKPVTKPAAKRPAVKRPKKMGEGLPENHTESEAIAYAIASEFHDLKPSVNRIMQSELREPGRLVAITLFRESLGKIGDPNRIPANAIAAGQLADDANPEA
jgi:hypothetical protein